MKEEMLQYLTNDLLPGYGLPKKRVSVDSDWVLRDSIVLLGDRPIKIGLQTDDILAIGTVRNGGYVYALHADATTHVISTQTSYSLKWEDLPHFLEECM